MSFIEELKRRNVIRVGIAYAVGAWLLAQAADLILDVMGAPDVILRSLVAILALGFIPAVLFAWAFEITPEGIKKEKDVDRTQTITHHTAKKLDIVTIALLVGVVALFAIDRMLIKPETKTGPDTISQDAPKETSTNSGEIVSGPNSTVQRSIAVLPFVDMSPAKDNEYFTDGLTEELLNILAQIKTLQVAGRTSSFAFKDKTEDLREIGEKLNVNTLLEGSVRKDDQRQKIRVTVQLINVADGYHIWSDTYDRDLEDIFAIQEDIARQVADALKINLLGEAALPIEDHARTDMNAYELYLKGLQSLNKFTFDSLREAEKLFREALVLDPDYQPAQLALAKSLMEQAEAGARPREEVHAAVKPLIDTVLENDPDNSDAYSIKGRMLANDRDYIGAQASFQKALVSNPRNVAALALYGRLLFDRDSIDEGLGYLEQAAQIDPYDVVLQWNLCITQAMLINNTGANKECGRIGDIAADNPMRYYGLTYFYDYQGQIAESMVFRQKAIAADPSDPELAVGMAYGWMDLGDNDQAKTWVEKAARIDSESSVTVSGRISLLIYQEQHQAAVDMARKAYADQLPNRHGSKELIHRLIAWDDVRKGDFNEALKLFQELLPEGQSPLESHDVEEASLISNIALVMKLQNPLSTEATTLLDHADELNQQNSGRRIPFLKPLAQAMIESARGNKSAAISSLRTAVDKGWRWDWRDALSRDLQFESLHNEPEFKQLVAWLEADMEKQRDETYQILGLNR